jgi:hypothetical protein
VRRLGYPEAGPQTKRIGKQTEKVSVQMRISEQNWETGRCPGRAQDVVRKRALRGGDVGVATSTVGLSLSAGVGRSRARRMTRQNIQGGSGRWPLGNTAETTASAGAACRYHCWQSGKGTCVLQAKEGPLDQKCVHPYSEQCCVGGPWGAGAGFWGGGHPLWALYTSSSDVMWSPAMSTFLACAAGVGRGATNK